MTSERKTSSSRSRANTGSKSSSSRTPTLDSVQNQLCPNCNVGVLQVIRWDPEALHERGQDLSADNQSPSGGAYEVQCPYCGFRESRTLGDESNGGDET